jgi:hypothetical protein
MLKSIRTCFISSKSKIVGLAIILFMPYRANAHDFKNQISHPIEDSNALVSKKITTSNPLFVKNQLKIKQIRRIQVLDVGNLSFQKFASSQKLGMYSYSFQYGKGKFLPIFIDKKGLKSKQIKTKWLILHEKELNSKLFKQITLSHELFNSAECYYSENKSKYFSPLLKIKPSIKTHNLKLRRAPIYGVNTIGLRMGKICEEAGILVLKPVFTNFQITPSFKAFEPPISSIIKLNISNRPYIYSRQEVPVNLRLDYKKSTNSNKRFFPQNDIILGELETMSPLVPFDPELNFFDFNNIWSQTDLEYHTQKANRLLWKSLNEYDINLKPKKGFFRKIFSIRKISIPTKRQVRDACVDGIAQFFRFKKWMHKNVQRPLTNFIRSKTGDFFLKSPHLGPFRRKYGFDNFSKHFTPVKIKYDRIESIQYRWQHYNKVEFNSDPNFLLKQCLDNFDDTAIVLSQSNFVPLPLKFNEPEFSTANLIYPRRRRRRRIGFLQMWRNRKKSFNKLGFEPLEMLIPQSLDSSIPKGKKTTNPEIFVISRILNYERKYMRIRNRKASRSWRYKIFYHRVAQEIMDETKLNSNNTIPPTFYAGPLFLKEKGISVHGTCGYGLGYFEKLGHKFYINPVTGLVSIYQNSAGENFYGDDETTYFGVSAGRGYYSDKTGVKYFYVENYDDAQFAYMSGEFSPHLPIQSRKNPFYWKREYYYNPEYIKLKKISGPWLDIRGNVRNQFQDFYEIKKDTFFDIQGKLKGGVRLKLKQKTWSTKSVIDITDNN